MKEIVLKNNDSLWDNILFNIFGIADSEERDKITSIVLLIDEYDSYIPDWESGKWE